MQYSIGLIFNVSGEFSKMSENKRLIMKFGGAALSSVENLQKAAERIQKKTTEYPEIVIVVSAMGETTNDLLKLAKTVDLDPPKREIDMLVTAGERISAALLSIALHHLGVEAVSLTGSQSGIITTTDHSNAYIVDVKPIRIPLLLKESKVVVVCGFQGVSVTKEITTLGRGGSDTTAVALGVALNAEKVEFYKDVDGVFTEDPRFNPRAKWIPHLSYKRAMQCIKKTGRFVIHPRAIELAQANRIPLQILSFQKETLAKKDKGSWIIESTKPRLSRAIYEKVSL